MHHAPDSWINATSSWTRIGTGSEFDSVHSKSKSGERLVKDNEEEGRTVKALISQLCETFYNHGWATGTGGGCSIRVGGPEEDRPWRVFVAPSGIQKEDMIGEDIFEMDMDQTVIESPVTPNLRQSACTPLWYVVYKHRPTAKCVIHTHSLNAQMATLLDPTEKSETLKITHLEMLKGVGNHAFDDVLEVPIIDNRPSEDLLAVQLEAAIAKYPKCNAVLVRRHGLYAWGDSWEQAKTQCESFDYLFESAVKMKSMGVDAGLHPKSGTYRVEDKAISAKWEENGVNEPMAKRARIEGTGFNNATGTNNDKDMELTKTTIPMVPRHSKILLLDIEGCTTSISSVKDGLFPYIVKHIDEYAGKLSSEDVQAIFDGLKDDVDGITDKFIKAECKATLGTSSAGKKDGVVACVKKMVERDVKATALKKLQGEMWEGGYKSGELKGHVYEDFVPALNWCKSKGVQVNIYSSGSVNAQKLLFGYSVEGDLTSHFTHHFDTKSAGNKKQAMSYTKIADSMKVDPKDITFVSDAEGELVAAREAGIGHVVMSVRPGNALLTDVGREFPIVHSLLQVCGM
jgi:methylthioribulose 1-phosphate dehydratase/enolase-phosphatase E1